MTRIDDMPEEVMRNIWNGLGRLDTCSCLYVNKRFYSLSIPKVWRVVRLRSYEEIRSFVYGLKSSGEPGSFVRKILFFWNHPCLNSFMKVIFPYTTKLKDLKVSMIDFHIKEGIESLSMHCKSLESCVIRTKHISDKILLSLGEIHSLKHPELYSSSLSGNLQPFAHSNIESLILYGCSWKAAKNALCTLRFLSSLKHFDLSRSTEDYRALEQPLVIPHFQSSLLETLFLSNIPISQYFVLYLKTQHTLKNIGIQRVRVQIEDLKSMANALPDTCRMEIEGFPLFTAKKVGCLSQTGRDLELYRGQMRLCGPNNFIEENEYDYSDEENIY